MEDLKAEEFKDLNQNNESTPETEKIISNENDSLKSNSTNDNINSINKAPDASVT